MNDFVDQGRLDSYAEAFEISNIKTFTDMEAFLMRNDISNREKLETLYIIYKAYNDIMDYVERRISDLSPQ